MQGSKKGEFAFTLICSWEYSCLLFIFAKERCEPKSHLITFILMGKGVAVFTNFDPLVNETHVCQTLKRKIWIYFEKLTTLTALLLHIYRGLQHIWIWRGGKKSQNVKLYLQNVIPTDVRNTVSLILPSLWDAFRLRLCNFSVKLLISTQAP